MSPTRLATSGWPRVGEPLGRGRLVWKLDAALIIRSPRGGLPYPPTGGEGSCHRLPSNKAGLTDRRPQPGNPATGWDPQVRPSASLLRTRVGPTGQLPSNRVGPQRRGPRRQPGNREGGEPSVPCPSGPARRQHWRTWRLREASAITQGGGVGGDCQALRKTRHAPRRFASTSGPGSRARTVMSGRGEELLGIRRRNAGFTQAQYTLYDIFFAPG